MQNFPVLYTSRLILRQISVDDIISLVRYANNKKIAKNIINIPYPFEEYHAVNRLRYVYQGFKSKTHYAFAVILNDSEELIGEISLHMKTHSNAELGYWIAEAFWNQGFATEAIGSIIQFGFKQL